MVRANPYLLVDREFEVEFSQADELALSLGVGSMMSRAVALPTPFTAPEDR